MVRQAISKFEKALKNAALLRKDPQAYDSKVFDEVLQLYVALNKRRVIRSVLEERLDEEDDRIIATTMARVPDLMRTAEERPSLFDTGPTPEPLKDANIESRIYQVAQEAPDGATLYDGEQISSYHHIFGDVFELAKIRANRLTGRDERYAREAIMPLIEVALPDNHIGARTLKAACFPLAVPNSVCYVLKGTVFKHGIGKVVMFDSYGARIEGYLETRKDEDPKNYLYPRKQVVILRRDYAWDGKRNALAREYVVPPKLIGQFSLRKR